MNTNLNLIKWEISKGNSYTIENVPYSIDELLGAFGPNQRLLTVSQIAKLHATNPNDNTEISNRVRRINELISNNLVLKTGESYFDFGVDIIDLKPTVHKNTVKSLISNGIYTQNSVNRAKNLYILSEQGYSLLINLMNEPSSKLIYKNVIRDYFRLKSLLLTADDIEQYFNRVEGKVSRKMMTDVIKAYDDNGCFRNCRISPYATETNFIYQLLFNMNAKDIEKYLKLNLKADDTLRNHISKDDLRLLKEAEERFKFLYELGMDYQTLKATMKKVYSTSRTIQPSAKNFKLISKNIDK